MPSRAIVAVVAVAVLVVGALLALRRPSAGERSGAIEEDDEPSINEALHRIEARLDALERRGANGRSPRRPADTGAAPPGDDRTPEVSDADDSVDADPEFEAEIQRRRVDERVAAVEAQLASEPVDRAWAFEARHVIDEAAASPELAGSRVTALTCRSTLCRLEVEHDGEQDADQWASIFYPRAAALPAGFQRRLEPRDGRERSLVFLARQGHRIPRGPQE